jgi:hypothetical protein
MAVHGGSGSRAPSVLDFGISWWCGVSFRPGKEYLDRRLCAPPPRRSGRERRRIPVSNSAPLFVQRVASSCTDCAVPAPQRRDKTTTVSVIRPREREALHLVCVLGSGAMRGNVPRLYT